MKKLYLSLITILFASTISFGQTVLFSDNFNSYDSASGPNYNGWQLTYYGAGSFYTSTQSSGPSGPNAYKFGRDSATAITPTFSNSADSVHFYMKANTATGGTMAQSALYLYESQDGVNWNLLTTFAPPPLTATNVNLALTAGTTQLKFFYDKDTGNVGMDDFSVTSSTVGLNELSLDKKVKVFPSPASTKLNVNLGSVVNNADVAIFNVIGNEVQHTVLDHPADNLVLNVAAFTEGVYLVKIKADQQTITRRIVVRH
jgi:hypothetical protein